LSHFATFSALLGLYRLTQYGTKDCGRSFWAF